MLLTVRRPRHLKPDEAQAWLRAEAGALLGIAAVRRMSLCRLEGAGDRWHSDCDWLIELDLDEEADAAVVVRDQICAGLLGDLRLLGMRPTVAVLREAWRQAS